MDIDESRVIRFRTIYDREIRKEIQKPVLLATMRTLLRIISNILKNSQEEKYRHIPATSRTLKEGVLERRGGLDFFLALGWRKKVVENREVWILGMDEDILADLEAAQFLLQKKIMLVEDRVEKAKNEDKQRKKQEAMRKEIALAQFKEDRQTRAEKDRGR